jgi:hypothetical protein
MTDSKSIAQPQIGIMFDIESLDLGPRSLTTQIAMYGFDMETEELLPDPLHIYLPMQAQLDLIPARTISADTFVWWMGQSDDARQAFEKNVSDSFEELPILMRQLVRRFNKFTNNDQVEYELIAKGPQFDIVNVESLLRDCGMTKPWKYDRVVDLRTLMRYAGMSNRTADLETFQPDGFIPHRADWDAKFQINLYFEAKRQLRSRG